MKIQVLGCYHMQQLKKKSEDLNLSVPQGEENMDIILRFMYILESYLVS